MAGTEAEWEVSWCVHSSLKVFQQRTHIVPPKTLLQTAKNLPKRFSLAENIHERKYSA